MRISRKGFTLIELLVVISIIALLASVTLATVTSARLKARDARRFQDLNQIRNALTLYYDTYSYYPVFPTVAVCGAWNRSDAVPNPSVSDTCWSELATALSTWLPVFPVDPLNGTTSTEPPTPHVYIYQTVNDGAGYRLGAVLETSALAGDGCALGAGAPSDFPPSFYCLGQNWE